MLSEADLAGMRSTVEQALPDTCTIRRRTVAADGAGGTAVQWADLLTTPCRIVAAGTVGREGQAGQQIVPGAEVSIWMPSEVEATTDDRVRVGDQMLEILSVDRSGEWRTEIRVQAKRVSR